MTPDQFTAFEDQMPAPHKHLIVTNNLRATNAHGEMSHVWLTSFVQKSSAPEEGLIIFTEGFAKVYNLTHWKYA